MRKWIYYCGSWASLIGCLLVASGRAWAAAPSRKRTKSPARSGSRRKNERLTAERRAEGWADTA